MDRGGRYAIHRRSSEHRALEMKKDNAFFHELVGAYSYMYLFFVLTGFCLLTQHGSCLPGNPKTTGVSDTDVSADIPRTRLRRKTLRRCNVMLNGYDGVND